MDAVKEAIRNLTALEWAEVYRWALLEEKARREREAVKEDLIKEILGAGESPKEEDADAATES